MKWNNHNAKHIFYKAHPYQYNNHHHHHDDDEEYNFHQISNQGYGGGKRKREEGDDDVDQEDFGVDDLISDGDFESSSGGKKRK